MDDLAILPPSIRSGRLQRACCSLRKNPASAGTHLLGIQTSAQWDGGRGRLHEVATYLTTTVYF